MSSNVEIPSTSDDVNDNSKIVKNVGNEDLASTTTTKVSIQSGELPLEEHLSLNYDNATKDDKVHSGDKEGENENVSKTSMDSNPTGETKEALISTSSVEKSRGATSRRGARGGSRRGGSRAGKGKRADQFSRGYFHHDTSDFHASLFPPMPENLPSFSFPDAESNEEVKNNDNPHPRVPPANYMSRDLMIQLATNINSGFFYINNACELIKQSQIELYHAKYTLERIYRSQHCNLEQESGQDGLFSDDFTTPTVDHVHETFLASTSPHHGHLTSTENSFDTVAEPPRPSHAGQTFSPTAEHVQVQLDPHQFMDDQKNSNVELVVADFTVGRGGVKTEKGRIVGRGPRGYRGGRGKRRKEEPFSTYNSEHAHQSLNGIIKRLSSPDGKIRSQLNNNPFPAIVLHDIQHLLDTQGMLKENTYLAAKVEASFDRKFKQLGKLIRDINPKPNIEKEESKPNKSEKGHDQSAVQVSNLPTPRSNDEENEQTRKRKLPPIIINNSTDHTQSKKGKGGNVPRWKQLRVEPDVMKRILDRLHHPRDLNDDPNSECSSVPNSQHSDSSKAATPIKSSGTEVKRSIIKGNRDLLPSLKLLSPSSSTCSNFPTLEPNNSSDESWRTPPDEEMLDLMPGKNNCACADNENPLLSSHNDSGNCSDALNKVKKEHKRSKSKSRKKSSSTETEIVHTVVHQPSDPFYNDSGTEHEESPQNSDDDENENCSHSSDSEDLFIEVRKTSKTHGEGVSETRN